MAETSLLVGVVAVVVWVAVVLIEGSLRPDYHPTYHTASELELGERGWIQRINQAIFCTRAPDAQIVAVPAGTDHPRMLAGVHGFEPHPGARTGRDRGQHSIVAPM